MSCSTTSTVTLRSRLIARTISQSSRVSSSLQPATGSSRSNSVGSEASARASSTRFWYPNGRWTTCWSSTSVSPNISAI